MRTLAQSGRRVNARGWMCAAALALALLGAVLARATVAAQGDLPGPGDLTCEPIPGETYGTLPILGSPTDRPAEEHPDLNLAVRGYALTDAPLRLVSYGPPGDELAPQLRIIFSDRRLPVFSHAYQAYHWDWSAMRRGDLITDWPVTVAGLAAVPGETVHVPASGRDIGSGYEVLVLYAAETRITLKYTREDNVVVGYTLHIEGICVEPSLLALYRAMDSAGRLQLPALREGQAFGRAAAGEVIVAIRDCGAFMDPRSRNDWWIGVPDPHRVLLPRIAR